MNKVLADCAKRIESLQGDIIDFRIGTCDVFIKLIKCTNKSKNMVWGLVNYQLSNDQSSEHDSRDFIPILKKNILPKRDLVNKLHHNLILHKKRYTVLENTSLEKNLTDIPNDVKFSLAFIDLYQYNPTLLALNFLHEKLVQDGIIIVNNFNEFDDNSANKAIKEFLAYNKKYYQILPSLEKNILTVKRISLETQGHSEQLSISESNNPIIQQSIEIISEYQTEESTKPLTIACVLKSGSHVYDYNYVNALSNAIAKHVTVPYTFTCLTDNPSKFNNNVHKVIKLKHSFPKWWSKIELFRPDIFHDTSQVFFLDLDTVITNNINDIVSYDGDFCGLRDFYKVVTLGSGLLSWKPSKYHHVYKKFLLKCDYVMANTPEGDQKWIDSQIKEMDYFQDIYGRKIISWKKDCLNNNKISIPKSASIVCFHGIPKPHEITDSTIVSNWQPYL